MFTKKGVWKTEDSKCTPALQMRADLSNMEIMTETATTRINLPAERAAAKRFARERYTRVSFHPLAQEQGGDNAPTTLLATLTAKERAPPFMVA